MARGLERGVVQVGRARRRASCALVALACSACVFPGPSKRTDRAFATAPPASWARIAVLPFDGAPELCRPAEELVALRIRHQRKVAIVTPLAARRALSAGRAGAPDAPAAAPVASPSPSAWIGGRADAEAPLAPAEAPSAVEIRAVAARLGVDGVVAGTVTHDATWRVSYADVGGAAIELVLFDATGAAVAVLRRRGSWGAAREGVHEAAMDATSRAADDLLVVLRTPPSQVPAIFVSPEPAPAE